MGLYIKRIISMLMILVSCAMLLSSKSISDKYETQPLDESEANKLTENLAFEFFDEYTASKDNGDLMTFSVNSNGDSAIVFNEKYATPNDSVFVYDKNGDFKYGIRLDSDGSIFIEWSDVNLCIGTVRSAYLFTFNDNGECIEVAKCLKSAEGEVIHRKKQEINGETYKISKKYTIATLITGGIDRLVRITADGEEVIIYNGEDAAESQTVNYLFYVGIFGILVLLYFIVRHFKNKHSRLPNIK
ncbi:MAG: hypothetical protein IJB49_08315 [Clostridia bacterium]|nr:hypothetical protein [Clostridia bacterium]